MTFIKTFLNPRGWLEYFRQVYRLNEYRGGTLVGMDQLGNRYYEITDAKRMLPFRNRYVEYAAGRQRDASQVPAEWHAWLHSINDDPPTKSDYIPSVAYTGHQPNLTGTDGRYVPYNTVRPKIKPFNPENATGEQVILAERIQNLLK